MSQQGRITSWVQSHSRALTYSPYRFEACMISAKLHVFWPAGLWQQVTEGRFCSSLWVVVRKQIFPCSSANGLDDPQIWGQKIFRFVAQPIHCGHKWLSEHKLFVLWNSPKGLVLWSEWLTHLFHWWKQDVNSSNVKKYERNIYLQVHWLKLLFLERYLFQVAIWNSMCSQQFKCLPWKIFFPV